MINNVSLTGRLTRDPELRYTQSGTAVASFTLAVNRKYKRDGDAEADFINCLIWSKSAEVLSNTVHKGTLIGVEGRIQTRNYENNQGQRVYVTEVVCASFSYLESKQTGSNGQNSTQTAPNTQAGGNYQAQPQPAQTAPQPAQNVAAKDPFAGTGQPVDISDDDLPF